MSSYGSRAFNPEDKEITAQLLAQKVGGEHLATRAGGNAGKLTYLEGWKAIELANSLFGFEGWSCSVELLTPDFTIEKDGKFHVGVTAIVKITLKDGTFHEDVGFGSSENQKHKGLALEHAKKEAVTDARKRALRFFGNALGNCVYDKEHVKSVKAGTNATGEMSYEGLRTGAALIHTTKLPPFLSAKGTQAPPLDNTLTETTTNQSPIVAPPLVYAQNAHPTTSTTSTPPPSTPAPTITSSPTSSAPRASFASKYADSNPPTSSAPPIYNTPTTINSQITNSPSTSMSVSEAMKSNMMNNLSNSGNIKPTSPPPPQAPSHAVSPNNPYVNQGNTHYVGGGDSFDAEDFEDAYNQATNQQPNSNQQQPNCQQAYQSYSTSSPQTPSPSHQKSSPYQHDGSSGGSGSSGGTPPKRTKYSPFVDVVATH